MYIPLPLICIYTVSLCMHLCTLLSSESIHLLVSWCISYSYFTGLFPCHLLVVCLFPWVIYTALIYCWCVYLLVYIEGGKFRTGNSEDSLSPESPLSPHFSPPPLRNAALKSMFPQVRHNSTGVSFEVRILCPLNYIRMCIMNGSACNM